MSFIARVASSAPSCEPETKMIRSEDRSGLGSIFSSASSIRDNITGTTTMAVTLCLATSSRTVAGLNLRCSTSVEPIVIAMVACR